MVSGFQIEAKLNEVHQCKGTMERGAAPFHIDRNGYHLVFDRIGAWICNQSGEVYFEEAEVESIQAIIQTVDNQVKKLALA